MWTFQFRPYAAGLLGREGEAFSISMTAFVLAMLSTIMFDGLLGSAHWIELETDSRHQPEAERSRLDRRPYIRSGGDVEFSSRILFRNLLVDEPALRPGDRRYGNCAPLRIDF